MRNRIKKVWSIILVAAIVLSFFPGGIFSVHAQAAAETGYEDGYTWAFDQTVSLGATKGLVSGNAAETIKVMNHEGNNSLTPNRAIADGVLTTTVAANWGNTVGHGVFYKLPAALEEGRIYQLSLNLYGGNEAAAMNGITVSFGDYTNTLTGSAGTIQQWQNGGIEGLHNTDAKLTRSISGNLSTEASNTVEIEFIATEAMTTGGWMLISFPLTLNGSYKLGSATMEVGNYEEGYTWNFDNTIAFTNANDYKVMQYGNKANTVGIISHSAYADHGVRSLQNGVLITKITNTGAWATGANGLYYKLPVGLTAGQEYVLSMNLYAGTEGTALINGASTAINVSFSNEIPAEVTDMLDKYWTVAHIEGIHNAETLLTYRAPDYLSADASNELAVTFVATQAMAENDSWMLISMPLAANQDVNLGAVTLKEKKNTDNHILNGDFSNGLTGWLTNHDSSYLSVEDSVLNVTDKVPTGDVKLYQNMYLEAGIYRLSFDVLGAPTSWRPVFFMGTGLDKPSVISSQRLDQESGKTADGWWTVTRDVTIETAGTYYFQMNLNQVSGGASVAPAMQYDNFSLRKLVKVTTDLNNASLSAETTTVALGQGYTNTLAANAGYELSEVTVTMGGVEVADAYDAETGKISIAAVTGDLHIQAEAVRKMLNITTELSNASLSTEITTIAQGEGYENTVIANAGYEVSKVTVTMGGAEVADAYNAETGKISVSNVTADLHIQVETVTVDGGNLLTNGRFNQGSVGWANNGVAPVATIANGVLTLSTQKADSDKDARTYAALQLAPGSYQLSFDVKGTPDQYRPFVSVSKNYWSYDYGQYFMYQYSLSETEWTTITETFTVPESAADANTGLAPVYVTIWNSNASYAPASEMQFDNFAVRKLLNVTTELSNAKLSADIKAVAPGQSYENTVTANAGYEVSEVTVTMGGAEVVNVYNAETGKISVSNVTADLHIQVETVTIDADNLLTNGRFNRGSIGWDNNGITPVATVADGVLKVSTEKTASGDAIFYQSMNLAPGTYRLTFDGKGTANQYRPVLYIGINQWDKTYGQHFLKDFGFDEEWKTVTVQFTIPESAADANTGLAPVYVALWTSNKSYAPETEMQLDNFAVHKLLNVTTELSNASLSAEITEVAPGQSYENTVTANADYEISKVTVTMGGVEVENAYDAATGKITIPAVTANLHIQVETVGKLLVNGGFDQGETGWGKNQYFTAGSVTDGVLVISTTKTSSDAIFYQSMNLAPGTYQLTFDGKGTANQYRPILYIGINQWDKSYGQYFLKDFGLGEQWKTATVQFTIPESAANANTGLAPVYVALWTSNSSYAPDTEMQLDNFEVCKLLNVATELSNAKLSADINAVVSGESYENTVTANAGYEISKVTVTMGGAEVTDTYDAETGKISVSNVTADLYIQVETTKISGYNLLTNGDFSQGNTGWASNAITPSATISDGVLTLPTQKTSTGDARTYTTVQLAPGIYQLSFDVKGTPGQYRPIVGVSKNSWSYDYGEYLMYQYDLSGDGWTTITENFIVPKSAADANTGLAPVVVTVWNSNASSAPETEMQFDNFKLCELESVIITWKNDDGTVLEEDLLLAGSVPEYNGKIPTKEANGHSSYKCIGWDKDITVVNADTTYTAQYEEVITSDHDWGEGIVNKAATCGEDGERKYTCSVCGETKIESITATGAHTWGEGVVSKAPTCDADGEMTYTCTECGEFYTEAIDKLFCAAQIGEVQYSTLQAAVNAAEAADVVVLLVDSTETVTVANGKVLNLDLNGNDVAKIVIENGGQFYGMDTTTDDYICGEDDYGKIIAIEGDYKKAHSTEAAGNGKRYVAVEDDGISFHRFYMGITHVALRPGMGGAGYTMTVAGDSKVQSILAETDAYGYTVSVTAGDKTLSETYSGNKADFVSGVQKLEALTVDHILTVNDTTLARQPIEVTAFIRFKEMAAIEDTISRSFQDIVVATDADLDVNGLSAEQINALCYMYNELGVGELGWSISNIAELAGNANNLVPASVELMSVELQNAAVLAAESEAELFELAGSTMTLGNTLEINFAINNADITGEGNYVVITKQYADERGMVEKVIPQSQWKVLTAKMKYVSFCVSAKEMNDPLTATVYNADGQAISETYYDSVAGYCVRMLNKEGEKAEPSAQKMSLFVDMVNYGAAAQTEWGYNVENLANAGLTDEQKALATDAGELKSILEKGTGYAGTTLSLKENILLNVVYHNETIDQAAYAEVSFTDHYGNAESATIPAAEFVALGESLKYVQITGVAVADGSVPVTVKLYNENGEVISTTVESVESYVARNEKALHSAVMAFCTSAYNYFHYEDTPDLGENIIEVSTNVSAENGQVSEAATFGNEEVSAQVPAGVQVESNTLTLTVKEKESSDSGIEVAEGEELLAMDIHIDGVSEENATAIQVCLGKILPQGLNIGNVTLYHVEDGAANAMERVMTLTELDTHNEFYYDPVTGDITVAMASFSEVAMLSNEENAWNGEFDSFTGSGTEEDPYIIANADQLAQMSKLVSEDEAYADAHYKLISDINLNGERARAEDNKNLVFYPIGYWAEQEGTNSAGEIWYGSGNSFTGVFDGNGNTISNIYQNTWLMDGNYGEGYWDTAMGLFGALWSAEIKNLTVDRFSSDGEFTPTGCIAAYAGGPDMVFENISLTNCNPRVYNTSNGGLVGLNYNSTSGTADELIFRNITVDQTNKISALWGSYDVGCGGILGRLRENAKHDGTNTEGQKNTVTFENCHVAAIMDVNNDCCANYQYYQYRYSGMLIGTVDYIGDVPAVGVADVVTASNTTVTYGDWNEYWYCELVKNSLASYTHDHQFSRLTEISSIDEIKSGDTWIKEGNFVLPNENNTAAECYHIFKDSEGNLYQHFHDVADETNPNIYETKDINGDGKLNDLKEDRQRYYIPFGQLWTGYGWGSSPMYTFEGVAVANGGTVKSEPKFESKDVKMVNEDDTVNLGDLFELIVDETKLSKSTLAVFVSPVGETSTVSANISLDTNVWDNSKLTFSGNGWAKIVITDYYYCKETVLYIYVAGEGMDALIETQIEGIAPVEIPS